MSDDIPGKVAVYTSAFRSSDCCDAPFWRVCFGYGEPDHFICRKCVTPCNLPPVKPEMTRYEKRILESMP